MKTRQFLTLSLAAVGLCAALGPFRSSLRLRPGSCWAQEGAEGAAREMRDPCTHLYDTGPAPSAPVPDDAFARPDAWIEVPEGDAPAAFKGDAIFLNDKLAVALPRDGAGAAVYSRTSSGWQHRALLTPCAPNGDPPTALAAVEVIQNDISAVVLGATFTTDAGEKVKATFRLTTGEPILEAQAGQGTGKLVVDTRTRHVVVPDFFGDDMVLRAEAFDTPRIGLPTENFFLNLIEGGDAIVMCVWPSSDQSATVHFTDRGPERGIATCEIEWAEGGTVWVAVLEHPGIWHSRAISSQDRGTDIVLDWRPPFQAEWRGSFAQEGPFAGSWNFRDERQERQLAPGLGEIVYPCWFDSERALMRMPQDPSGGEPSERASSYRDLLIAYPIAPNRATPLTVLCPIDVIRRTLGVGPCQYILAMEGLGQQEHPTPDAVTQWVERQFKRNRDKRQAEAIREKLNQMAEHVQRTQERIERYNDFARYIGQLCAEQEQATAGIAGELRKTAQDMERNIALRRAAMKTPEMAGTLADSIAGVIGQENALAECERLGKELRSIGAAQDNTLAKCRMSVRWLKQQCRMAAAARPEASDFARQIQAEAEQMLQQK